MSVRLQPSPLVRKVFNVLKNAMKEYPPSAANGREVVMRVAGGWVRDQVIESLKGQNSYDSKLPDIDVALDCVTGIQFAESVNKYLEAHGAECHSVGVVKVNAEQSKHLEVAILTIDGLKIDCLQLRHEEYAETSRIPEVRFGTPLEDAMRRDFTCNAMFYNINKDEIEDFTGRGLQDLMNKTLVTPLDPWVTLLDDPLRSLRGVRFSCRLGFQLDQSILAVTQSKVFREALSTKVSRERMGCEVDGAFRTGCISGCIDAINKMGLLDVIFVPIGSDSSVIDVQGCLKLSGKWLSTLSGEGIKEWIQPIKQEKNKQRVLAYASMFLDQDRVYYRSNILNETIASNNPAACKGTLTTKKAKLNTPSFEVMRHGLKLSKKDSDDVAGVINACLVFEEIKNVLLRGDDVNYATSNCKGILGSNIGNSSLESGQGWTAHPFEGGNQLRMKLGRLVRSAGSWWREGLLLAMHDEKGEKDLIEGVEHLLGLEVTCPSSAAELMANQIQSNGLEEVWADRGLLVGGDIMNELKIKGAGVRDLLHDGMLFSLTQPNATKEDIIKWLKTRTELTEQ
eukprot:GDKJ01003885.1.p1 GENE.GDKJ01003885.1~~GDKJ01003885.1.p1  ORF type:complete len:567 (-),score=138.94 GDKJ01003885.1:50-1750(-)